MARRILRLGYHVRRGLLRTLLLPVDLSFLKARDKISLMKTLAFTYWQDGDAWLGHLDEFPDYLTQGESLEDLKAHLLDLFRDLTSGEIPCVRRHAEMEVA